MLPVTGDGTAKQFAARVALIAGAAKLMASLETKPSSPLAFQSRRSAAKAASRAVVKAAMPAALAARKRA